MLANIVINNNCKHNHPILLHTTVQGKFVTIFLLHNGHKNKIMRKIKTVYTMTPDFHLYFNDFHDFVNLELTKKLIFDF